MIDMRILYDQFWLFIYMIVYTYIWNYDNLDILF